MDVHIDLELYRVFYAVASHLNFSNAAKSLFISQSAVSQSIKQLESKLGSPLFIRSTKQVVLTKAGEDLLSYVAPAIHLLHKGATSLLHADPLAEGHLHIGASDTICRYFLLPFLETFHQHYPKVRLKITNRTSSACVDLLQSGQVDLIVTNLPNEALTPDMTLTPVKTFHDVFVASHSFLKDKTLPMTLEGLMMHPILLLERSTTTSKFLMHQLSQLGLTLKPEVELGSIDLLIDLAKIGMGIAFVPDYCMKDSCLTVIPMRDALPKRHLAVAYRKKYLTTQPASVFIQMLSSL